MPEETEADEEEGEEEEPDADEDDAENSLAVAIVKKELVENEAKAKFERELKARNFNSLFVLMKKDEDSDVLPQSVFDAMEDILKRKGQPGLVPYHGIQLIV